VVKTSLKLLLVFVEYTETNTQLLLKAVNAVDSKKGKESVLTKRKKNYLFCLF